MQILQGVHQLEPPLRRSALTVGNFDGVHLGHRELIRRVTEHAHRHSIPGVVMTFEPHPVQVLYPDRHMKRLFDLEDQHREMKRLGIDILVIEPFSREFSQLPPERYIREWIHQPFHPELLVVGYDFAFGAHKSGTLDVLSRHGQDLGFALEVVPPVRESGHLVSSSRIRQAIGEGDVALAARLLGRRFYLAGLVEKGAGRGRTLGVPTANLRTAAETVPLEGVYAARVEVQGATYAAAVNIGRNPTFQTDISSPVTIEAHLIGFSGDLYGLPLTLEFVERLRDERKFSSKDALVEQIRADIAEAANACVNAGVNPSDSAAGRQP
ncbi:MAG: bifunctional riboflavin kinase/FAD synthetase [Bdellovibrionaceae bacterium]|nr:bifunctional riboflavin kinase/FAD synthetase [Pseudobdellovibrionaceae bacterium]